MRLRSFNALLAALSLAFQLVSPASLAQGIATASPAAEAACTLNIGGIPVELGITSFKQCVSYARSSLLGKTDKDSRDIRFANRPYRVGQTTLAQSLDGGSSWLAIETAAPARIGALDLAVMVPGAAALVNQAGSTAVQASQKASTGDAAAVAPPPPPPPPAQPLSPTASSPAMQTTPPRITPAARAVAPPAAPAVIEAPKSVAHGGQSTATNGANGFVPPATVPPPSQRPSAIATAGSSATAVSLSELECRYQTAAGWVVAASSAVSAKDCGIQILKKVGPTVQWPVAGGWNGRKINVVYTTVYSSVDGVNWDTE
jgi:hypothetical protein